MELGEELIAGDDLRLRAELVRHRERGVGEVRRPHVFAQRVDQVAREEDATIIKPGCAERI
jgi:hypothetical protein